MYSIDGSCVLITGASSGLGAEFARQLAPRAKTIILVARREQRLQLLAEELRQAHPQLHVYPKVVDLQKRSERKTLFEEYAEHKINLLINNAGLGDHGEFHSSHWEKNEAMLRVNIEALTHLTHLFLPQIIASRGAIVNVSSLASTLPVPDLAVYAASKAYVSSFSQALQLELQSYKIPVLALCPGPVKTEFGKVADRQGRGNLFPGKLRQLIQIPAPECVRQALLALEQEKARHFPGLAVALSAAAISALPLFALRYFLASRPRKQS